MYIYKYIHMYIYLCIKPVHVYLKLTKLTPQAGVSFLHDFARNTSSNEPHPAGTCPAQHEKAYAYEPRTTLQRYFAHKELEPP